MGPGPLGQTWVSPGIFMTLDLSSLAYFISEFLGPLFPESCVIEPRFRTTKPTFNSLASEKIVSKKYRTQYARLLKYSRLFPTFLTSPLNQFLVEKSNFINHGQNSLLPFDLFPP